MIAIRILGTDVNGQPDDNQRHWLAGTPGMTAEQHTGAEGINRNQPRNQSDDGGGPGHPYKVFFDRGNASVPLSFNTSRLFASMLLCWRWCNSISDLDESNWPHPFEGDAVERINLASDAWEESLIKGCVLAVTGIVMTGQTAQISYQLKGSYRAAYRAGSTTYEVDSAGNYELDSAGNYQLADTLT